MNLQIVEDVEAVAAAAALMIAEAAATAVRERGRCMLALAGGATPRPIYERLAAAPMAERMPWAQVDLFFGDERCVPPDDPESNYRMVRESLLAGHSPAAAARLHRIEAERADREAAAAGYAALLPERLDLILLGMGEDGHTASLFPGSAALAETERRTAVVRGPKPPPWRITVTPPVLACARMLLVVAAGAGKSAALAAVLGGPYDPDRFPAQLARHGTWIVDRAAASALPPDRAR